MVGFGHAAIIPDNVIFVGANGLSGDFPIAIVFHVGFFHRLPIDEKAACMEGKGFAGKSDDAFHEHEMDAGVTNSHDIASLWRMGDISEAVDKMDAMVAVGGQHADAFDANGEQYEAEDNGARIMIRTIVKDGLRPTIARCSQEGVAESAPPFPIDNTCAKPLSVISFVVSERAFKEIRRLNFERRAREGLER